MSAQVSDLKKAAELISRRLPFRLIIQDEKGQERGRYIHSPLVAVARRSGMRLSNARLLREAGLSFVERAKRYFGADITPRHFLLSVERANGFVTVDSVTVRFDGKGCSSDGSRSNSFPAKGLQVSVEDCQ